ncbi:MAG: hypothetical protein VR64_07030 [Desulfatitalea sp. BRH_c12]|nr:MAG: hypothetical protein VR64_07030 [Desulfatitalea sp. BRH_c12]
MAKKRLSRKELIKGPDEFITLTGSVIQWARGNTKPLLYGTAAFFAVIILIAVYSLYDARRERAATALLSESLGAYQVAESREGNAQQALTLVKPQFERLIDEYGGQSAGRMGRVIYAHIALKNRAADDAIVLYRRALSDFGKDLAVTNAIRNGLATAYLEKGDNAAAVEEFRQIADSRSGVLKDTALFNLGRLYRLSGDVEKSKQAYEQLRSDFPDSIYGEVAKEKAAG